MSYTLSVFERAARITYLALAVGCGMAAPALAQHPADRAVPASDTASGAHSPQGPQKRGALARLKPTWVLENRRYYDPLVAEVRAAQVAVLAYARVDAFPYMIEPGRRRVWDISLGKEIPIAGWEVGPSDRDCNALTGDLVAGCWGVGVWIPVSFHMVEDFKDDSNPIINTDYRFSGMLKAQWASRENLWVAARLQTGHESTHLGDEFAINALRAYGSAFERVNVSYEYWEYGVSLQRLVRDRHWLQVRHGGIILLDDERGFYSNHLLGSTAPTLTPSTKNYEPSLGFEWMQDGRGTVRVGSWNLFTSADLRLRTIYDFHKSAIDAAEDRQWSLSLAVGFRNHKQGFNEKGVPQLYFRLYRGVNPNGQFRTQRDCFQWGIGIHVPV